MANSRQNGASKSKAASKKVGACGNKGCHSKECNTGASKDCNCGSNCGK